MSASSQQGQAPHQRHRHARAATGIQRRPADLAWLALGVVVLMASALPVHTHRIATAETGAFRFVNHAPSLPLYQGILTVVGFA